MTTRSVGGIRRREGLLFLLAMALVATACGSTVQPSAQPAPGTGDGLTPADELGEDDLRGGEPGADNVGGTGGGEDDSPLPDNGGTSSEATDGTRGQTDPDAAGSRAPATNADSSSRSAGPGITADKITIGIGWFDPEAGQAALAPGRDPGSSRNNRSRAEAVVRWINEHGGIAGRQIDAIYHEFPISEVATSSSRGQREQAMCSDFTEDHRAFAAIPVVATEGVFYQCAAKKNLVTVAVNGAEAPVDRSWYDQIGHIWYHPNGFLADRRDEMLVDQLHRGGFFTPGAKVGLVVWDDPPARRAAEQALEPALDARGVEVVAREFYSDISHVWQNAVLRFQSAGVTHVVWGSTACPITCTDGFMRASESQRYRPFNGVSTDNGIRDAASLSPASQAERLAAVGWAPLRDGGPTEWQASDPLNDNDAQCREIAKGDERPNDFVWYCDGLFFIKQALEAAPELTWQGFRSGVEGAGYQFQASNAFSTAFGPARHDGANAVRDLRYDRACGCMRFSSPVRELG